MKRNLIISIIIVVIIAIIIGTVAIDLFVVKKIDEQTARKMALDYAYTHQKGVDWAITSVTVIDDIWTIILNGQTVKEVMEIKIDRNTGEIIGSRTCCG